MLRKTKIVMIWFLLCGMSVFAQTTTTDGLALKEAAIAKWQKMFGREVDFHMEDLFEGMVYIGPQPDDSLISFKGKKLIDGVKKRNTEWYTAFFKTPYRPLLDSIRPSKYYIPKGPEASFLNYQWKSKAYHFNVYESFNGMLIRIKCDSMDHGNPLTDKQVSTVLFRVLNLKGETHESLTQKFKLPAVLSVGTIFSNSTERVGMIRDWTQHIIGFTTKTEIVIICFKANGSRAEMGFTYVGDWLNTAITQQ
jgi:hypothetical protein